MAYSATGSTGNDTLNQAADSGPGTIVGLAGDDCIFAGSGAVQAFGNSGNDSVFLQSSSTGSVFGGSENDFILGPSTGIKPLPARSCCSATKAATRLRSATRAGRRPWWAATIRQTAATSSSPAAGPT